MIVGLTGLARSGKSTVAEYLRDEYHFDALNLSDMLVSELEKKKKKVTKENLAKMGDELRKKEGMDAVAKRMLEHIYTDNVVISGFRSPEEVDFLREKTPKFVLILVETDEDKRFERRDETESTDEKKFHERDARDLEKKGMENVFLMADFVVHNNGKVEDLFNQVDDIMKEVLEQ